uniref:Junctophilin-3 n=1 Tax=Toxoplasma gondii (strain ATCC 50861 / VEG) TaxID=432359 RepID=A0A0F7UXW6_TOXGV|nr:TPA: Junctophilin-3 [Toxoplasma gondii VEG]
MQPWLVVPFVFSFQVQPDQHQQSDSGESMTKRVSRMVHELEFIGQSRTMACRALACTVVGNVACYRGEWKDNKRHGFGIQTYLDGSTYEGQWREDRRHGHGIMWEKLPSSNFGSAGFAAGAQVSASLLWPVAARQAVGRRGGAGCGRGKVSSDTSAAFSTVFACYIFITKTCGRNKNIAMT